MKICYVEKRFGTAALSTIRHANAIIDEYTAQGYELTLRQLYYQFVSLGGVANNLKNKE